MKTKLFFFISLMLLLHLTGINAQNKDTIVNDTPSSYSSDMAFSFPDMTGIEEWLENHLLIVIIGGSAILLLVLVVVLLMKRKSAEVSSNEATDIIPSQNVNDKTAPTPKENLKTMIIPAASSRTLKFIPGELEVMTGDDKGRIIRISGYPAGGGSTVTIGREPVTGPRDFAHIQFKERTISRKQAEIIYKEGKLYIKNLSETNFTCLDGREIPVNTVLELKSGSILTFGEVEMKYNV